jgi:hypothetical protein
VFGNVARESLLLKKEVIIPEAEGRLGANSSVIAKSLQDKLISLN